MCVLSDSLLHPPAYVDHKFIRVFVTISVSFNVFVRSFRKDYRRIYTYGFCNFYFYFYSRLYLFLTGLGNVFSISKDLQTNTAITIIRFMTTHQPQSISLRQPYYQTPFPPPGSLLTKNIPLYWTVGYLFPVPHYRVTARLQYNPQLVTHKMAEFFSFKSQLATRDVKYVTFTVFIVPDCTVFTYTSQLL